MLPPLTPTAFEGLAHYLPSTGASPLPRQEQTDPTMPMPSPQASGMC